MLGRRLSLCKTFRIFHIITVRHPKRERTGLSFKTAAGPLRSRVHILLPQIRDFPFRRLLWLAGLRWRYSTPPPHGIATSFWIRFSYKHFAHTKRKTQSVLLMKLVYGAVTLQWTPYCCHTLKRERCLPSCFIATENTHPIVACAYFGRGLAMDVLLLLRSRRSRGVYRAVT
jgi:hypothetical protein